MNDTQIRKDLDSIDLSIETPHDDSEVNLQALERDNWGRILNNKTFKSVKENFRLLKSSISNFLNEITTDISNLTRKQTDIENEFITVKNTVNNLKDNGSNINNSTLTTLANKETTNTFKELNTFEKGINTKSINLDNNTLGVMEGETITIGDINKSINIIGKDTTLKYNGEEIKGGSGGQSVSANDVAPFIAEYPLTSATRITDTGHNYLFEMSLFEGSKKDYETDLFQKTWIFNADVKKSTKPIQSLSNNVFDSVIGNSIVANINSSDGNLLGNSLSIKSELFNKVLMEAFDIENSNDLIKIKNLCGLRFKFSIRIDQINDSVTNTTGVGSGYTSLNELCNSEEKEFEIFFYNESNNVTLRSIANVTNRIKFDSGNVKEFYINSGGSNNYLYFNIEFKNTTFKDLYNAGNRLNVIIQMKQIKLLKLTTQSTGGGSGGSTDFSSTYGLPILAETINNDISIPSISIKKIEVTSANNINENDYIKVFNGELPINSYYFKISDTGQYNIRDVPLYSFITYSGMTYGDYFFIPNTRTDGARYDTYNQVFNDNIRMIPYSKVYGLKLKYSVKIEKFYSDTSRNKVILDKIDEFNVKFVKDVTATYDELLDKRNILEHLDRTNYNGGDYIRLVEFDKIRLFFKFNKAGAYNKVKVYNSQTKTFNEVNVYSFFYIEGAKDLFSDDFTEIRFTFNTISGRIIVKL